MVDVSIRGSFSIKGNREELISFLTDLNKIVECIPNVEDFSLIDDESAKVKFRVSQGSISDISMLTANTIVKIQKGLKEVAYYINGKIVGSSFTSIISLDLKEEEEVTIIDWRADVNLGNALKLLKKVLDLDELIRSISDDTVKGIIKCVNGV